MFQDLFTGSLWITFKKRSPLLVECMTPALVTALRISLHPTSVGRFVNVKTGTIAASSHQLFFNPVQLTLTWVDTVLHQGHHHQNPPGCSSGLSGPDRLGVAPGCRGFGSTTAYFSELHAAQAYGLIPGYSSCMESGRRNLPVS